MLIEKINHYYTLIKQSILKNFRFATLDFIFIIVFISVFQALFGMENSIVGVIFAIMMAASMARDLTATPIKHLLAQAVILVTMAAAACAVSNLEPLFALPINFIIIFFILYAFTYEYASHLYFPYILSYLFLIFISPITPEQLPKRLFGMLTGAVCIILYQLFMGRNRVVETVQGALSTMLEEALECIDCLLTAEGLPDNPDKVRTQLRSLSKLVYERRKKVFCISDASFCMLDAGRGLENLILLLYSLEGPITLEREKLLKEMRKSLENFTAYVHHKEDLAPLEQTLFKSDDNTTKELYHCLTYIREHLLHMTKHEKRLQYQRTMLSFSVRLKAALDVSPVRFFYALRVACLLAICSLIVQVFALPHGRWLLFTVASVSLPYADDVGKKAMKRFLATILGGVVGITCYAIVPSTTGRTIIMMLSGYLSFYFSDYMFTFTCSTVGALGSAVFLNAFGWTATAQIVFIRLCYIFIGIVVAYVVNCKIFPFKRELAMQHLWKKYENTTKLLTHICKEDTIDTQLYYSLIVQSHMIEDKLCQNVRTEKQEEIQVLLKKCQNAIRAAHHHKLITNK